MKIAITGSSGYIGTNFIEIAALLGHEIICLSRTPPVFEQWEWIPYDLNDSSPPRLPHDIDFILHLAYRPEQEKIAASKNDLESMQFILSAANKINARVIFLSSQTAKIDGVSQYGKKKWELEQLVISSGNIVIRPGLVFGGNPKGLFLNLINTLRRQRFIPAFLPTPQIQPIHIDDLCICILKVMELTNSPTKIFYFGKEESIAFTKFMQFLAKAYLNKSILLIPMPARIVLWATERLKNKWPKFAQIASLLTLPPMNTVTSLDEINYQLKPFVSSSDVKQSPVRELLQEGFIIFSYITRRHPDPYSLRRYARLIKTMKGNLPLQLPAYFTYFPILLCAYDRLDNKTSWLQELNWRINSSSLLIEASTKSTTELLKIENNSFLQASFNISIILVRELLLRSAGNIVRHITPSLPPHSWGDSI
jgi:nucleoside-diphosphate-sugar epimerase